jgi:hypothetical protein
MNGSNLFTTVSLGICQQYAHNKIIEITNDKKDLKYTYIIDTMIIQHKHEMDELKRENEKLKELLKKKKWWKFWK